MPNKRLPRSQRRTNDVRLALVDIERDALDRSVDRARVSIQKYLRTVIVAIDAGEITVPQALFERQL